ncbi:MAG: sugar phosphate isomerase/epimerase, partial [Clostridia bacterium]|nr:sugar phosphate isomerase/epimerase [Clostridia bacterium]
HAKDGVMLKRGDPEKIYRITPRDEDFKSIDYFKEMPLGQGSVDFPAYLRALDDIGYKGFLTIEREVGDDPAADILTAKNHLMNIIKSN